VNIDPTHHHPLYGPVTIERRLKGGAVIVMDAKGFAAVVPSSSLSVAPRLFEEAA
jgi:hypothetical protein